MQVFWRILGFVLLITPFVSAQDQEVADSLRHILESGTPGDSIRMELLKQISFEETDPVKLEVTADELISLAERDSVYTMLLSGYLQKGNANLLQGNLEEALESFFQSLEYAYKIEDLSSVGALHSSIADVYSIDGNNENAIQYYNLAITTLRQTDDAPSLGNALYNTGDQYLLMEKYDTALLYFNEAGEIFRQIDYPVGIAYNLGNIGAAYAGLGENELAERNINEAVRMLEGVEDYYPISVFLIYMADIYMEKDELPSAQNYARRALILAQQYGLKDQVSEANLRLSTLYEESGDPTKALQYYKDYIAYRDSVSNIETVQKMADLRTEYEVSQKQIEVDLLNQQKRNQQIIALSSVIAFILIGLLAIGLYRRNQYVRETSQIIEREKERSENLLRNILPEETARELKEHGKVQAKSFPSVTVLFTDFKSFTSYAERLTPEALVKTVDYYFSKFDEIIEQHGLEKIKTIGDAYMCAGGLPDPVQDHALRMIDAALTISRFVEASKKDAAPDQARFDVRIGISTGPVVAGVIGAKKFAYDIWGDTVNIASRMESNSEPGKINVSETTYELIKDHYHCEYRGEVDVKNRGSMKMYFVLSPKKEVLIKNEKELT
jgi:adenylate cyclase